MQRTASSLISLWELCASEQPFGKDIERGAGSPKCQEPPAIDCKIQPQNWYKYLVTDRDSTNGIVRSAGSRTESERPLVFGEHKCVHTRDNVKKTAPARADRVLSQALK
jgi:hypothetical protein